MDSVGLKHVTRDTADQLCLKITTNWPHSSRVIPSQTGAKRPQIADAPDTQERKTRRKYEGEELSVHKDGKTRKAGPENTESGADGEGLEDVTGEVPVSLHVPEVKAMQDVGGGGAKLDYHALDQTIWAHLEFEDGHIVPLKNSVSTSFYIGREPSANEHHHQFLHEADNVWRRVSAKHCHILRLDTGFFSSCISCLTCVLLILMKYVN